MADEEAEASRPQKCHVAGPGNAGRQYPVDTGSAVKLSVSGICSIAV